MNINIRMELFKENNVYVALCPELNVGSHGETVEQAKKAFREAVTAFFEECRESGVLEEVLEESGFLCRN